LGSGVALVAYAIAALLNDHRLGVVEQAVEQGRGQGAVIVADFRPLLEAVRGNHGGAALVALTDHLEQAVGSELVDREIPQFVDLCGDPHKSMHWVITHEFWRVGFNGRGMLPWENS
jgi:hypothetical protein